MKRKILEFLPWNPALILLSFSSRRSLFVLESYFFPSSCVYKENKSLLTNEGLKKPGREQACELINAHDMTDFKGLLFS